MICWENTRFLLCFLCAARYENVNNSQCAFHIFSENLNYQTFFYFACLVFVAFNFFFVPSIEKNIQLFYSGAEFRNLFAQMCR